MSVKVRPFRNGGWEVDIQFCFPDGTRYRDRRKAPVRSESAARRWAEARERVLLMKGERPSRTKEVQAPTEDVPTLEVFSERFMNEYARANREKPSGIATKESILRTHLLPLLGPKRLDAISTADVQKLKARLRDRTPKTVNNVLTVLSVLIKTALNWQVIERLPCTIRLVKTPRGDVDFHDFSEYTALVEAAEAESPVAYLAVLLGGEAGLRCGEIIALEWGDVDLERRQITVARSEWRGHVTPPKSGRLRRVPMTDRLAAALREAQRSRGRVLSNADGTSLTEHVLRGIVRRLAERAGVSPGLHILRHSFCSHLAMRGASGRAIQELAGHENLSTTQRYMHISPAALDAAIGLLNPAGPLPAVGDMLETTAK